jgi:hypothetical protein
VHLPCIIPDHSANATAATLLFVQDLAKAPVIIERLGAAARSPQTAFRRYALSRSPPLLHQSHHPRWDVASGCRFLAAIGTWKVDVCLDATGANTGYSARLSPGNCSPVPTPNCTWSRLKPPQRASFWSLNPVGTRPVGFRNKYTASVLGAPILSRASTRLDLSLLFRCRITRP